MEKKGQINLYTCESCDADIVTVNRDDGVTPYMIRCERCGGVSVSAFYRVDQATTPTHEYYRPAIVRGMSREAKEHVSRGGLLLRKIEPSPAGGEAK